MKKISLFFTVYLILIVSSCMYEADKPITTLLGKWETIQETSYKIYPRDSKFSSKSVIQKVYFSFQKLDIQEDRIKIVYGENDFAFPYYKTTYNNATKLKYIIADQNIYEYYLANNQLIIRIYSPSTMDNNGSNYSYNEIILRKE